MNYDVALILAVLCVLTQGCASVRPAASTTPVYAYSGDAGWLSQQPVPCGEVHGRVLDARDGRPLTEVYVNLDSAGRGVSTDSLGRFRLVITPFVAGMPMSTRPTTLWIRRIGFMQLRVFLPPNLGYAVDVSLAPRQLHVDHVNTIRIKDPGFCDRAT